MAEKTKETKREPKAIAPWRPFSEMARWESEVERMFDDFLGKRLRPFWDERWWPTRTTGISTPPVDLYEGKDELVAKVELPGIARDDIQINITDNRLTIKGEKKKETEVKEEDYHRSERYFGSFIRSIELPGDVQAEKTRASFSNGVLEIHLPKTEQSKRKEIKVKVD